MRRASPDGNPQPTGIFSNVKRNGAGDGGDIAIDGGRLVMRQGAAISAQTSGAGAAGAIDITLTGRATVDDSVVETSVAAVSTAPTAGGQIAIRRPPDRPQPRRITTNGVIPAPGASILSLDAPIVAINRSTVTSLTAAGEPLPGVRAGRRGDRWRPDPDLDRQPGRRDLLAPAARLRRRARLQARGPAGHLLDASALLRERCAVRRDVGASSFTATGRGGLPPSPDQPLGSAYRPPAEAGGPRPAGGADAGDSCANAAEPARDGFGLAHRGARALLVGGAMLLAALPPAAAQGLRPGEDRLEETRPPLPEFAPEEPPPVLDPPPVPPPAPEPSPAPPPRPGEELSEGLRVFVRAFGFSGNTAFDDATLAAVLSDYTGRTLSTEELIQARDAITRHYVAEGYVSSAPCCPIRPSRTA